MKFNDIVRGTITRFDQKGRGVFDVVRTNAPTRPMSVPFTAIGDDILLNGVTYTIDDPSALEGPARESAVRNAQRAAEDIAKLTGVDLGDIVAVEQLTTAASPAIDARGGGAPVPAATGGGFYPGQTEVVVVLRVTFAIK